MRLNWLVLALTVACAAPLQAADANGDFVAKGVGVVPCSTFIAATKQGGAAALGEYAGYIAGYTSAYNEISPDTYDVWAWQTMDTMMLLLLQRCQQNPDLIFGTAMIELTRYYQRSRISTREPKRLVGSEASGFYLYESIYEQLLDALRREGYSTRDPYAALMQYKVDNKVVQKANVNQILLLRLLAAPAAKGR